MGDGDKAARARGAWWLPGFGGDERGRDDRDLGADDRAAGPDTRHDAQPFAGADAAQGSWQGAGPDTDPDAGQETRHAAWQVAEPEWEPEPQSQPEPQPAHGADTDAVISLRGVSKSFGSLQVLRDVSFDVPRGEITAVLGPSGTGKSVLLNTIIGMEDPDAGQIYVDGEPLVGMRHRDLMRVRRKFGVLFQDGALFGSASLYDNLAFPLREHTQKTEREIRDIVHTKADMVGLMAHLHKMPGEVSGGMRKRAGLARALALDPEIVFFDEPDSGLDPVRVAHLDKLVKAVQRNIGCTFFVITHNIDSVRRTADNIGMLFRSELVTFGPAAEVLASRRPIVRQFFEGSAEGPIGMDESADAADGDDIESYADSA